MVLKDCFYLPESEGPHVETYPTAEEYAVRDSFRKNSPQNIEKTTLDDGIRDALEVRGFANSKGLKPL